MPLARILIKLDPALLEEIRTAAQQVQAGAVKPNVSAWIRLACEEKLKRDK